MPQKAHKLSSSGVSLLVETRPAPLPADLESRMCDSVNPNRTSPSLYKTLNTFVLAILQQAAGVQRFPVAHFIPIVAVSTGTTA